MIKEKQTIARLAIAAVIVTAVFGVCGLLFGHCDTMNGPVVLDAKKALEKGDVTTVLKWVKPEYEKNIRDLFKQALIVRGKGPEAKALADNHFFETLVRLHRAGEGAAYTGLKSDPPEPIVAESDRALEAGSAEDLVKALSKHLEEGVRERFAKAVAARKRAGASVSAGREYVKAYITFMHYVEGVHQAILSGGGHEEGAGIMPSHVHE